MSEFRKHFFSHAVPPDVRIRRVRHGEPRNRACDPPGRGTQVRALAAAVWLDAVQLHLFGLPVPAAAVLAVVLLAPVVVAVTRPLLAWHLAATGQASCVVIFGVGVGPGYNDAGWPWPVCAMAGFGFVLFWVAARSPDRLLTASTALVTVLAVYLPGLLLAGTSLTTAGILTAATVGMVSW